MTIEEAITKQVKLLRKEYDIDIFPNYVDTKCNECDIENFKFAVFNNLEYEQISLTKLGITEPYHRASLLGFNTGNGLEWFIVDPTYGQFFHNEIFNQYMSSHHLTFSHSILEKGYVKCTLPNIYSYLSGFVFSNAFTNNINSEMVYNNLEKLLSQNNISKKKIKKTTHIN